MKEKELLTVKLPYMEPEELIKLMNSMMEAFSDAYKMFNEKVSARAISMREIPLDLIDPFEDHPFYVNDDEDMMDLAGSVSVNGLLVPASVREKADGRYEMLSGHRRMRACRIAGIRTMRCEVLHMDDAQAAVFVVEANRQRTRILPGEKAFAFELRQKAEAEYISEDFSDDVGLFDRIDNSKEDREHQIQKCISLTELIPELMEMVDEGKIGVGTALELARLPRLKQGELWLCMEFIECTPSLHQVIKMRTLESQHMLTNEAIEEILTEPKPNQRPKISLSMNQLEGCIPEGIPDHQKKEYVIRTLETFSQVRKKK